MFNAYQPAPTDETSYIFHVEPMMCNSCVQSLDKALQPLNCPTLRYDVNIQEKLVQIRVPNTISSQQIINTLSARGISAEPYTSKLENPNKTPNKYK